MSAELFYDTLSPLADEVFPPHLYLGNGLVDQSWTSDMDWLSLVPFVESLTGDVG